VLASTLLPPILAGLRRASPGRAHTRRFGEGPGGTHDPQNHKADVAISQAFASVAGIEVEKLLHARAQCAMPASHRLAKKNRCGHRICAASAFIGWLPNSRQP